MGHRKLTIWKKLGYGIGDISQTTGFTIVSFFFLFYLTDVVGIDPRLAGYVLLFGKVWDAITDPAMGIISDRTASNFGRRRLYMMWGALPYAITFILLWIKPAFITGGLEFIYYTAIFLLHSTALTVVIVPYNALSAELTQDYDERTSLFSYRMVFSILFGLVAAALPPLVKDSQPDRLTGYMLMGLTFSALIFIPMMVTAFTTREKFKAAPNRIRSFRETVSTLWKNVAFRIAALVFLFSWMVLDVVAASMEYYVTYVAQLKPMFPAILGALFISSALCIPLILWLSNTFGKPMTYIIAIAFWMSNLVLLFFIPSKSPGPLFTVAILSGVGVAAIHVIPMALAADVVEVDELITGERREGIYFGILTFMRKVATGVGLFFLGNILAYSGYVANAEQPDSALTAIRIGVSFIPMFLLAVAVWIVSQYPLTQEEHTAMVEELEAGRESSIYV
ncbi:MAG: MFS transporter [Candidatus Marinimicrobia bacterium]|nr:MFS transporter [Candidatus Neomarinimicrobiota bacterium]MCF7828120.1 MFS transporter [Candidatus Neomarinimicrobiota bacterium]MCF7879705.1 MFS transporter [Candidatus Neomarinimicrobiota bacterium]